MAIMFTDGAVEGKNFDVVTTKGLYICSRSRSGKSLWR